MEKKTSTFFTYNTPFGVLMGICLIAASFMCFRFNGNIYANTTLDRIILFLYIIGLFMQLRKYRESEYLKGDMSYGTGVVTGMYLSGIVGVLYGFYVFIIYSRHPEALNNYLDTFETLSKELYSNSSLAGEMNRLARAFTTPAILGLTECFGKFFMGLIYTLIIAAFLKKKASKRNSME